jgi:Flp pilus assembly protein TadG
VASRTEMREFVSRLEGAGRRMINGEEGAQLVELSFAVPILLLFLLGIISFGGAFEQRNKMAIALREGARLAASESTLDLNQAAPPSINAIRAVVQNALQADGLNCAIDTGPSLSATLQWTYTSSGCANLSLVINRGYTTLSTDGVTQLEGTQVRLAYPYSWTFASFLGGLGVLPQTLFVQATVMNAP